VKKFVLMPEEYEMKRTSALVVVAAMICSNCAARGPALGIDRPPARQAARPAERLTADGSATPRQDADIWRQYAVRLPIGSTVKIRTTDGERLTAVLLTVDDAGITVKPRTRIPVPAQQVAFGQLVQLELTREGWNIAKAAAIGGAVGAGVFLGLMMLLFANVD
jgi:hypothetical protein